MTTVDNEYYQQLYHIQDENFPTHAVLLPSDEKIYQVNLKDRTVEVPEFLSVVDDHKAETVYFEMDRFFNYMDLTNLACVIQYINGNDDPYYYPVPFYDISTRSGFNKDGVWEDKLLIPWVIDGNATAYKGTIMFSIRFYKIDAANHHFLYNLTTKPVKTKILSGMEKDVFNDEKYDMDQNLFLQLEQEILEAKQKATDKLYWIIAE